MSMVEIVVNWIPNLPSRGKLHEPTPTAVVAKIRVFKGVLNATPIVLGMYWWCNSRALIYDLEKVSFRPIFLNVDIDILSLNSIDVHAS